MTKRIKFMLNIPDGKGGRKTIIDESPLDKLMNDILNIDDISNNGILNKKTEHVNRKGE